MSIAFRIHKAVNRERRKRRIHPVYWSVNLAKLALNQAKYCAKIGRMVHSKRYAFQGGENLFMTTGRLKPMSAVRGWLRSKKGHREYLLSNRVTQAGVGIAKSRGKTYVAWAFSDGFPMQSLKPITKKIRKIIRTITRQILP